MADFRAFTIAASVTAIVLGAGIGAALGAISGPQPPLITSGRGPASGTMAGPTPRVSPPMGGDATMDHTASGASGMRPRMYGGAALTGPGVQRLQSMPTGTVRVWRDLQGMLQIQLDLCGLTPGSIHTVSIGGPRGTALDPEVRFPACQPATDDLPAARGIRHGAKFGNGCTGQAGRLRSFPGPEPKACVQSGEPVSRLPTRSLTCSPTGWVPGWPSGTRTSARRSAAASRSGAAKRSGAGTASPTGSVCGGAASAWGREWESASAKDSAAPPGCPRRWR